MVRPLPPYVQATIERLREIVRKDAEKHRKDGTATLRKANAATFQDECIRADIDPAGGVSPALVQSLRDKGVDVRPRSLIQEAAE